VLVVQPRRHLPQFMRRLQVLCHSALHPLPVMMRFIAESTSDHGSPMAVYACPFQGCRCRQGWVQHRSTDKPRRLWAAQHDGR
jgi:hypothetical protein